MADDIELDAESMQSDLGSGQAPVRKAISLKLKKPKGKPKSSKQSKPKPEAVPQKKENDEGDVKTSKPSASTVSHPVTNKLAQHNQRDLSWSQPIVFVGEKVQDPMIHVCEKCSLPVLVYGRLNPCKHVFCLTCAEKARSQCPRCETRIERIEPAGIGQIYVCSFGGSRHGISGCRRSYLSQRDLLAHIRHRHQRDGPLNLDADMKPLEQKYQQTVRMPFFDTQFHGAVRPPQGLGMPRQGPMDSYGMMQGMQMPDAMFRDGPRMHGGNQYRPIPPQPFPPPMNPQQPPYGPDQTHLSGMAVPPHMQEHFMPHSSANAAYLSGPGMPAVAPSRQDNAGGQFRGGGLHETGHGQRTVVPHSRVDAMGHVDNVWHPGNPMQGMVRPPDDWQQRTRTDMQRRYPPHNEGPRFGQQFYK